MLSIFGPRSLFTCVLSFAVVTTGCAADDPENLPPTVTLDVRSEETYVVGEDVVRIQANATDPEGGPIRWEVVNRPERAELQTFRNSALLTWDPITSDVTGGEPRRLIFAAIDSAGQRTERVVNLTILAGNGVPRFISGASYLFDASSQEPIEIDVQVRDDDSDEVALSMLEFPAGANFEPQGVEGGGIHRGRLRWSPTLEQRQTRIHTVRLVADDGENEPVTQQMSLIFQDNSPGVVEPDPEESCEADRPLTHEPLGAQRTLDPYIIEADFSPGAEQIWEGAYLLWADENPLGRGDVVESVDMKIDGAKLRGVIPNPTLREGESKVIYYSICLVDEDAPEDSEERFFCAPPSLFWSFHAYSPDERRCVDDDVSAAFSSAETIDASAWGAHRGCAGAPNMHRVTVPAGELVEVFVTYSAGEAVTVSAFDEAQNPIAAVADSECFGLSYLLLEGSGRDEVFYVEVLADDAPYQIRAFGQTGSQGCPDDALEPNNTTGESVLIFEDEADFQEGSICTADDVDVYAWYMLQGDEVLVEAQFSHAAGDLDMSLFAPSQTSEVGPDGLGAAESWSETDDEFLSHIADESGVYHLAVFTVAEPNDYRLSLLRYCGDDDAFGDVNHALAQAAPLSPGTYASLKVCAGSPDWYARAAGQGGAVLAELAIEQGARVDDVSFEVLDDTGQVLAAATQFNGRLSLDFTAPTAATYYYRVSSSTPMIYELTFLE